MRVTDHQTALDELEDRGYEVDWITEDDRLAPDMIASSIEEGADSTQILDKLEIEGQIEEGLFEEDPDDESDEEIDFDFTNLFTRDSSIIGRMMYFMISTQGTDYQFEDLVDDVEQLADEYGVPFDREEAVEQDPNSSQE